MCADDMSVLDALHGRDGCFDDRSLYLVMNTDHKTRAMICRIDDLKRWSRRHTVVGAVAHNAKEEA